MRGWGGGTFYDLPPPFLLNYLIKLLYLILLCLKLHVNCKIVLSSQSFFLKNISVICDVKYCISCIVIIIQYYVYLKILYFSSMVADNVARAHLHH